MENLEQYISAFPGCALIVSHDRAFLDCTCDYLFVIENNKITLFAGSYTQYKEKLSDKVKETQVQNFNAQSMLNDVAKRSEKVLDNFAKTVQDNNLNF